MFRDSFMFLTSSLESLVQSLRKTDESQFKHLESLMSTRYPASDFKLILRKGVFSYEYLNSFDKFEDYELPLREEVFITLRGEECSQGDYNRHSPCIEFSCIMYFMYQCFKTHVCIVMYLEILMYCHVFLNT